MSRRSHSSERILIVGGGFAGLSAAVRLAEAGYPVTVLEASKLGHAASTRNQGWLHSGAWFARRHPDLARQCYESLQQTLAFCPECVEPDAKSMVYFASSPETGLSEWMQAWDQIGIPYQTLTRQDRAQSLASVDSEQIQAGVRLPDRSFRPDVLLSALAEVAHHFGVEIRAATSATELLIEDRVVQGVCVGAHEEVLARLVILAAGACIPQTFSQLYTPSSGRQSDYRLVCLKAHLRAVSPVIACDPFCVVDSQGLNHLPHYEASVFGTSRWIVVPQPDDTLNPDEIEILEEQLSQFFPNGCGEGVDVTDWAGTTVQAMHVDQIEPGEAPLPTIVDHASEPCGIENVLSIFPGRATLWTHLAEKVVAAVTDRLGPQSSEMTSAPWQVDR